MKNLKKLSRDELRNVSGGKKSCTLYVKQADGTWKPYNGECTNTQSPPINPTLAQMIAYELTTSSYCETGLGNVTLSSNGGSSHCND